MKKLYESFESFALTVPKCDAFFESNPTYHQYDTYLTYINTQGMSQVEEHPFKITKMMAVMLTK